MLPSSLLDLDPEAISLNAMCLNFGIADELKRLDIIRQGGGFAVPTMPLW